MPKPGDVLEIAASGERVLLRRVEDDVLELDHLWPVGHRTARHAHPRMEERWLVVAGTAGFRIGGEERIAVPGDRLTAAAGVPHSSWNAGDEPVQVRVQLWPGLRWAEFVERLFALTAEGDGDRERLLALIREFPDEISV